MPEKSFEQQFEEEAEKVLNKKNFATKTDLGNFQQELEKLKANNTIHDHKDEEPSGAKSIKPDAGAQKVSDSHSHATHSYDKFCPGCGKGNPEYKEPDLFCKDCDHPLGNKDDAANIETCPGCGSREAYVKEDEEEGWF